MSAMPPTSVMVTGATGFIGEIGVAAAFPHGNIGEPRRLLKKATPFKSSVQRGQKGTPHSSFHRTVPRQLS